MDQQLVDLFDRLARIGWAMQRARAAASQPLSEQVCKPSPSRRTRAKHRRRTRCRGRKS